MTHLDLIFTVPMNRETAIPYPESHFSFSTKLMVLAIELHLRDAPRDFCHYVDFAYKKLFQFFESRREMAAQSYSFFVEQAYNQFFQHEAFHQSARARTKAKDIGAGEFHSSTKLQGYVWIGTRDNIVQIPKGHAEDVEMQEGDGEEEEEEEDSLPTLEVSIRPQPQEEEKAEDVGSQTGEETSHHSRHSDDAEMPVVEPLPRGRTPEERYGNFMIQQLKPQHRELLRTCAFKSQNVLRGDHRDPERELSHRDQVGSFAMVLMMEYMAHESQCAFLDIFQFHHRLALQMNSITTYVLISKRSCRRISM